MELFPKCAFVPARSLSQRWQTLCNFAFLPKSVWHNIVSDSYHRFCGEVYLNWVHSLRVLDNFVVVRKDPFRDQIMKDLGDVAATGQETVN